MHRLSILAPILVLAACSRPEAPPPAANRPSSSVVAGTYQAGGAVMSLPKAVGDWARPAVPRRITAETIFDYMDGGGEFYLAYRFDHLDVFEYTAANASSGTILAELYWMETSDDAFGLLSNDWGGEAVVFDPGPGRNSVRAAPARRALYGAGLLRMWSGSLYVRLLASRETGESREAVLRLGADIMAGPPGLAPRVEQRPPPGFLRSFDSEMDAERPIRPERTCLFRSHLVLNAAYFLASEDILALGPDVLAATTEYAPAAPGERPVRVIVVRYPSDDRARAALQTFGRAYMPEATRGGPLAGQGAAQVEHGWIGWTLRDRGRLTVVLDAPDRAVARRFAEAVVPVASDGWS